MKKENSEHNGLVEVTTDYTEPKKSAKVLHAVAGVAGAAAVLTGAVFGLKFLNDHGGLKEGGSDELRAGYHEETTAAATMLEKTVVTEQPEDEETVKSEYSITCAPSGIDPNHFAETDVTYEFDDYSAHISGYNYDGLVLKVKYELTYKDEDIVNDPILPFPNFYDRSRLPGYMENYSSGLSGRYLSQNGNVFEVECDCLNLSAQDSFDTILFDIRNILENNKGLSHEEMNTEFAKLAETHDKDFTAYRTVPDIPVIVRNLAEEMPTFEFSDGKTVHPTKLYLSAYGVFIDFDWIDADMWQKILPNMEPARITLTMSDGSEVTIRSENKHGTRHDGNMSGRDYVGGLFDESIDTRNVVSVNILDEQFVTFEKETLISDIGKIYAYRWDETSVESESAIMATWDRGECKNILDAVGDVLDFGDMTATIEKVDYDGHFIRVIYKADYHGGLSNDADWWFYQQHRRLSLYSYRNPVKNHFEGSWDTLPELGDDRFILATEITLDEGESIDNLWFEYIPEGAKLTEESVHIGSYIVNGVDHEKYDRSLTIRNLESEIGVINLSPNGMIIISNIDFMCEFAKEKDCLLKYKDETTEVFESSNYGAIYYEELDEEYIDSILAEQGLTRDDLVPRAPDEDEKNGWTKLVWMKPGQIDVDNVAAVILNGEEISCEKKQ